MQCGDNVLATRYTVQFQMVKTSTKENSPHKEIECVEECGGGVVESVTLSLKIAFMF